MKSGTSHFIAAFKVEKARVDNINELILMQRDSTIQLQHQLVELFQRARNRVALWEDMTRTLFNYSLQLSEIDQLAAAVELLGTGKLPHYLVNHTMLARALVRLEDYLSVKHPELQMLRTDIQFYYRRPIFRAFRYLRYLIIILEAPLTTADLLNPMGLYSLQKIPLLSPNSLDHYTLLSTEIIALMYDPDVDYYVSISDSQNLPRDEILDLANSYLLLRSRAVKSCASALLEGHLEDIKAHCRYHIVKGRVPPGIIKLDHNTYLLSNISAVVIRCAENITHTFRPTHVQVVHKVHCGCSMQADDFLVIATSLYCPRDDNLTLSFEPKYLLNLPYLSEFIEPDIMTILKRINFLNQSIPVELPQLLIASKQYEAKLGIEQESKFDLQAIINQTLNDEITFDNLGHYLYNEVIKGHTHNRDFDILNGFDWAIIAAILVGLLAIALSVRLHFQV